MDDLAEVIVAEPGLVDVRVEVLVLDLLVADDGEPTVVQVDRADVTGKGPAEQRRVHVGQARLEVGRDLPVDPGRTEGAPHNLMHSRQRDLHLLGDLHERDAAEEQGFRDLDVVGAGLVGGKFDFGDITHLEPGLRECEDGLCPALFVPTGFPRGGRLRARGGARDWIGVYGRQ